MRFSLMFHASKAKILIKKLHLNFYYKLLFYSNVFNIWFNSITPSRYAWLILISSCYWFSFEFQFEYLSWVTKNYFLKFFFWHFVRKRILLDIYVFLWRLYINIFVTTNLSLSSGFGKVIHKNMHLLHVFAGTSVFIILSRIFFFL